MKRTVRSEKEIWDEIWSRKGEKEELALSRVKLALDLLGSPQALFASVLSLGEGKRSASRLLESLLRSYGVRAGLFCPQAKGLEGCIKVNGESPSPKRLSDLYEELENFLSLAEERFEKEGMGRMGPMEVLLCFAALEFSDEPVDDAVFEVPGGREDLFSALRASGVIFTPSPSAPLPLDLIAPSSFALSTRQEEGAEEELEERALEAGACLMVDGRDLEVENDLGAVGGQVADLITPRGLYPQVPIKLFGEFQAHFALLALAAGEKLLSEGKLEEDLVSEAFSTVSVPGSLKVIGSKPLTLSDAASSPFKMDLCLSALKEAFNPSSLVAVVAAGKEFQPSSLEVLENSCDFLIATQVAGGMGAEGLFNLAQASFGSRSLCIPDFSSALEKGREAALGQEGGCALVTGCMEAALAAQRELN